jgi:hypothetical protein
MKAHFLAALVLMILLGCSGKDPIRSLVQRVSREATFPSGPCLPISLPSNASTSDLLKEAFKNNVPLPLHPANIRVIETRDVVISGMSYSASLVETGIGRKIVLLRYEEAAHFWISLIYDTKK